MAQVNPSSPKSVTAPARPGGATLPGPLPQVRLEMRRDGAEPLVAEINDLSFVIGSVPGCDLRLPGAELPPVVCVISRHAGGARLRKLVATWPISLNGQSVATANLSDGDQLGIGSATLLVRVEPKSAGREARGVGREELEDSGNASRFTPQAPSLTQEEVLGLRQELADVHRQLYERYRQRRDRLAGLQNAIDQAARNLQERKRQVESEAREVAGKQEDLQSREADLDRVRSGLAEQNEQFSRRHAELLRENARREAKSVQQEQKLAQELQLLEKNQAQYQRDLIRLDRLQATLDQKQEHLRERAREVDQRSEQLQRTSREIEERAKELDLCHERLEGEQDRLAKRKEEQEGAAHVLSRRASALEGQQATLAALRTRLEREREELRAEHQLLADRQARLHQAEADLVPRLEEAQKLRAELDIDVKIREDERRLMESRRQTLESAVAQLQQAQEAVDQKEAELDGRQRELETRFGTVAQDQARLEDHARQLNEQQEQLRGDRQALREREAALVQAEQARVSLQDQLRRRSEEIAQKERELAECAQDQAAREEALAAKLAPMDREETPVPESQEPQTQEPSARGLELERLRAELAGREQVLREHWEKLRGSGWKVGTARKTLRREQALLAQARSELARKDEEAQSEVEAARAEAIRLREQLPELEQRAKSALDRLGQARAQMREHLAELHAYANQSQEDIEALRSQLQAEDEQLQQERLALHRAREEHRLAVAAFRQQLIEWQGQVAEMKRSLADGETQLERRQAEVNEQARQIHASSARLAEQAELLQRQELDVAERRQEMESHLEDMRQWYRQKLRQLSERRQAESGALSEKYIPAGAAAEEDPAAMPRNILQITGELDPGDRKLGDLLRSLALVDAPTLTSLLLEARRQRRTLRQILLAGGYLTLYQMALIEAGNLDGLVLGRLRVVDRLAATERESTYRVYDPLRGHEVLLRHLSEAEVADAAHAEEFRHRFGQATQVQHPHVSATFEVLEIGGRPAALQEWLVGLPSTEWPPLAAAPGVWYRLFCQAALGLHTAHQAGVVHGHLRPGSFTITGEGILKITGLGEPAWLATLPEKPEGEPDVTADLLALGRSVEYWWALSARRKGARPKPLGKPLQAIASRLTARKPSQRYPDAGALLEALESAGSAIPPNAEVWDRFLQHVREHATEGAGLRESA